MRNSIRVISSRNVSKHALPPPQSREKIYSDQDSITLEDESGRIKLVGQKLASTYLVTGVIIAALGMETPGGEFEVIDTCFADLAPFAEQHDTGMDVDRQVCLWTFFLTFSTY